MKTFSPTPENIDRQWYVVDASDQVLGRLASQIAHRLRGKHKPEFAPHMDNGDFIVVVNCEKIRVTGSKLQKKVYYSHTGWVGGLKETTLEKKLAAKPEEVLRLAVRGMLPKTASAVPCEETENYAGAEHPHAAPGSQASDLPELGARAMSYLICYGTGRPQDGYRPHSSVCRWGPDRGERSPHGRLFSPQDPADDHSSASGSDQNP